MAEELNNLNITNIQSNIIILDISRTRCTLYTTLVIQYYRLVHYTPVSRRFLNFCSHALGKVVKYCETRYPDIKHCAVNQSEPIHKDKYETFI